MPALVISGTIDRLEIENFKSYKGNQVIGPFKNFTAIIGPNGAGKSNLMDAISFVLGVRSMQLRGSQLKDLIYAFDDSERDKKGRKGHVKLVYVTSKEEELHFTRTITTAGSSEYKINDKVVTWDEYNAKMKSLGILVKARNFLVFQGDVESIASKNPKELTTLFEQISASEELKKDYEQLEEQKARAEEKTAFNYQKRKAMAAERKQKKEQKEEAEKHLELQEDLKALKTDYSLWQLFTMDKDVVSTNSELELVKEQLHVVSEDMKEHEVLVSGKKKLQAELNKEVATCEKKIAKKNADIEKRKPDMVRFKEELKRVQTQIKKAEEELETKRKAAEKQAKDIELFQRSLDDVNSQLQDLSEQDQDGHEKLQLAESQVNEYRKMKEEAGKKTARLRQDRDGLNRQQQSDVETLNTVENDMQEVENREKALTDQLEQVRKRHERSTKALEDGRAELSKLKADDHKTRDRHRKSRNRAESAQTKLEDVERQLKDLKADKRESERDIKIGEILQTLKRLFPGVQGRLSELCKPREKKYNLAVSIVMGRTFDAVVVDEEKTGKDCIEYLREQHEPPMTFIPLQSARVKPIQERLRTIGGSAKLLIDVIEYEKAYEVALLYAVGNTLVCDSVDEAKGLAWGAERHKVVALDGTLLAKGGAMTGGVSGSMEAKSSRWNERTIEALKQERDKLQNELAEIPSQRDIQVYEHNYTTKLSTCERKITYAEMEVKMSAQKITELEQDLQSLHTHKDRELPRLQQLREAIAGRAAKIKQLDDRIHEIEDRIYRAFSESVGVANIREYEENRLKQQEELASRKLQLSTTKSRLENQLQFEQRRDTKGPVEQLEKTIQDLRAKTIQLKTNASDVKGKQESATKELEALQKECGEIKAKAAEVENEIQALKKEASGNLSKAGKLKRDIGALEAHIEQLKTKRNLILENCELDQIKLKSVEGDTVPMDIDSGGPVARGASFDYSQLDPRYRQDMRQLDRERLDAEFKSQMEALSAEIERTAPNLKALEQYEALKEREKESVDEFEAARREAKELSDRFNALKQDRYARFMDAFTHISTSINQIYKELTMSSTHPLGGTAYLALENEDEPFLGGIRYTAMPPTKRFRDMEQLSGGEKTVAALALLFAIHSFRPSPFFVLDEVDAALDNLNVAKVAAYIRNKSRDEAQKQGRNGGGVGFQSVVISLKDQFYDKADALVGVYRDADQGCSKTLTFDLTKFSA